MQVITQRKYNEMLGVLPPVRMGSHGIVSGFLVGEPVDHEDGVPVYAAYFVRDGEEYYSGDNMSVRAFDALIVSPTLGELLDEAETPDDVALEYKLREQYGDGPVDAYLSLGFEQGDGLESFEDAYAGEFASDKEFAQDMHEQTGMQLPNEYSVWPYTCIDWEQAARELMYDYAEERGYYFRNC